MLARRADPGRRNDVSRELLRVVVVIEENRVENRVLISGVRVGQLREVGIAGAIKSHLIHGRCVPQIGVGVLQTVALIGEKQECLVFLDRAADGSAVDLLHQRGRGAGSGKRVVCGRGWAVEEIGAAMVIV